MLTIKTSAHILKNRHRRSVCPTSTGVPLAQADACRLHREWRCLLNAESRRLWLDERWRAHLRMVRSKQVRRRL